MVWRWRGVMMVWYEMSRKPLWRRDDGWMESMSILSLFKVPPLIPIRRENARLEKSKNGLFIFISFELFTLYRAIFLTILTHFLTFLRRKWKEDYIFSFSLCQRLKWKWCFRKRWDTGQVKKGNTRHKSGWKVSICKNDTIEWTEEYDVSALLSQCPNVPMY